MVRPHQGSSVLDTKVEAMAALLQGDRSGHRLRCLWIRCVIILGPLHPLWGWDERGRSAHLLCRLHLSIPSSEPGFPIVSTYPTKPSLLPSSSTKQEPHLCLTKTTAPAQKRGQGGILVVLAGGYWVLHGGPFLFTGGHFHLFCYDINHLFLPGKESL